MDPTANICRAFLMDDPAEAHSHILQKLETVREYGDSACGHLLHVWDDGCRLLCRCRECGGYILLQKSEYHGMEDDDYYTDFFPVSGPDEADELNQRFDGFEIERVFPHRYLLRTNWHVSWSRQRGRTAGTAALSS